MTTRDESESLTAAYLDAIVKASGHLGPGVPEEVRRQVIAAFAKRALTDGALDADQAREVIAEVISRELGITGG